MTHAREMFDACPGRAAMDATLVECIESCFADGRKRPVAGAT